MPHISSRLYSSLPTTVPALFPVHPLALLLSPANGLLHLWSDPPLLLWTPTASIPSGSPTRTMSRLVISLCHASPSTHCARFAAAQSSVLPSLSPDCTRLCLTMRHQRNSLACPMMQLANPSLNHTAVSASTDPAPAGTVCDLTTLFKLFVSSHHPPLPSSNHVLVTTAMSTCGTRTLTDQLQLPFKLGHDAISAPARPSTSRRRLRS